MPDAGQGVERLLLPDAVVAINQVDHRRLQHEIAAIDPASIAIRLLLEVPDLVAIKTQRSIAAWWLNSCKRGLPTFRAVVLN